MEIEYVSKYTSVWEQRKVSDMFKVARGYVLAATLTAENQSETMPFPVYSSQTKDNGLMGFYKDYLYEDAITWTTDGANAGTVNYRAGKFYCTNVCGVLLSDKITANQMVAEALNNVAKRYVSYVGNPKLMNNVMADIEIMIPSKQEEREQISNYFEYLDHLITLHQCKCLFFDKMEIFTWEQRKLGEVLLGLQNNTLSRAELSYEEGTVKNVHYGDILVRYGEVIDVKNEQLPNIIDETVVGKYEASFLQNGDVVFADTAEDETVGKCSEIAGLTEEIVISGLHTIPYRPRLKFAAGYLGYYFNSNVYHQQLIPLMQGIKVTSISKSAMQNTEVKFPKSVDEQAKVGLHFRNLDALITLHQQK